MNKTSKQADAQSSRLGSFYRKYVLSLPKAISLLTSISVVCLVLIDFWLIDMKEIFEYGHEVGKIIYNLSIAIIASFIFYFFVVHIEKQDDHENLSEFIRSKIDLILIANAQIATSFSPPSKNYKEKITISDSDKASELDWFQYVDRELSSIDQAISDLLVVTKYLDSNLVKILTKIRKEKFHPTVTTTLSNMSTLDLHISPYGLHELYFGYSQTIKKLFDYAKRA